MVNVVDCFCGAGGSTTGLVNAGFHVKLGMDHDAAALAVYRANHKHEAKQMDLGNVEGAVQAIRGVGAIDLLSGSPPCTDFSSAGGRVERATHAGLTLAFAKIAVAVKPRVVMLENVPELLRSHAWTEASGLLVGAGYSLVVLRVNAAACGVAQVRRRVFVLATLGCNESVLRAVQREARKYNATPKDARTVRDCLHATGSHSAADDMFWYAARNKQSPCVFSTDAPCPTLRCNCLSSPPPVYDARHDDAGPVNAAHVLTVNEAAEIASFPKGYFDGVSKTAAAKFIGNCVCPKVAETVAEWCKQLLASPVVKAKPISITGMRRHCSRVSRVQRLVDAGLLQCGGTVGADGTLSYVGGFSKRGDGILDSVLGWKANKGWRVVLRPRLKFSNSDGQAPLDDLWIHVPAHAQPYRSIRQLQRSFSQVANPRRK